MTKLKVLRSLRRNWRLATPINKGVFIMEILDVIALISMCVTIVARLVYIDSQYKSKIDIIKSNRRPKEGYFL